MGDSTSGGGIGSGSIDARKLQGHEISPTAPTEDQELVWDDTIRQWVPSTVSSGGGGAWGTITGTLSAQTDLQSALDAKFNSSDIPLTLNAIEGDSGGGLVDSGIGLSGGGGQIEVVNTLSGITLTVPATGTLGTAAYTDSTSYQAADADLTTWAGITPAAGVGTFLATPSGANLASALTTALPASKGGTGLTSLGTGIATSFGVNIGSVGAPVLFNGAGGTPSSLTLTNATGLPESGVTSLTSDLALKAPLASPTFTGTVVLPSSTGLTTPKITTGILDANGNSMLAFTPTASAVDGFTFTNAATASPATVTMAATGTDSNINLALTSKGTGLIKIPATFIQFGTTSKFGDVNGGDFKLFGNGLTNCMQMWSDQGAVRFQQGANLIWSGSVTNADSGTIDLGIKRNAASVLEINNGTGGTFAGLKAATTTLTGSGAASTPSLNVTGVPFAGTGTTSFPLVYINDAGATASTTLSTAGTYFGININGTQDGFTVMKDGTSVFKVDSVGAIAGAPVRLKAYTVATLPAGTQGDTAFCTDLLTPTYLVAAVGGGAVVGPVFYNGTAWVSY